MSRSCSDSSANPAGNEAGYGFPMAKFLALVDVATGMISRVMTAPLRSTSCPASPRSTTRCKQATS